LACNFTIPGGEIDLIVTDQDRCVFVEVKVVNTLDDLHDHLTPHKQQTLSKTITTYLQDHPVDKEIQVDLVYIKHDQIVEYYPNIILSTSYL
jgi:Holliday junction resolvase-like predicted endonuclease